MAIDVSSSIIKIGAAQAGPHATIEDLDNYDWTKSRSDVRKRFVFGKIAPHVKSGDKENSYSFSGLYNPDDTGGQNVLETAFEDGSDVWMTCLPDGAEGWMEKCKVTQYSGSGARDGDYVEVAFQLEGDGVKLAVTGA